MNPLMIALNRPDQALVLAVDDGDELRPITSRSTPAAAAIVGGTDG